MLYPAPLRDFLVRVALASTCRAHWTMEIHEEWIRNLLRNRPDLSRPKLERTCDLMNQAVRDCLVTGYEELIETLSLPDADDRHVLAAAIHARAEVIVTFNAKDFPQSALSPYGIEPLHPDDFVSLLLDADESGVALAARRQREALKNPPVEVEEFLGLLEKQGLTQSVARLRPLSVLL